MSLADELQKLADLRHRGSLTADEFEQAKRKLLTVSHTLGVRRKSTTMIAGLPLWAIASGPDPASGEMRGHAKAIIAIGDIATGVLAIGGFARGVIALGGLATGVISAGGFAIGLALAVGRPSAALLSVAARWAAWRSVVLRSAATLSAEAQRELTWFRRPAATSRRSTSSFETASGFPWPAMRWHNNRARLGACARALRGNSVAAAPPVDFGIHPIMSFRSVNSPRECLSGGRCK